MGDKRVNRYRSGAKNPHRQVLTSDNDDGSFTVAVLDEAKWTLNKHTFPGGDEPRVEQGSDRD